MNISLDNFLANEAGIKKMELQNIKEKLVRFASLSSDPVFEIIKIWSNVCGEIRHYCCEPIKCPIIVKYIYKIFGVGFVVNERRLP